MRRKEVVLCSLMASASLFAQEKRPNVLFILADDFGWNDTGCMGSKYYETPNLDRIARSGVLFTNAYAACQVSSPSRVSIMTGKTPARHGVTNWIGEVSGTQWRKRGRHSKLLPASYEWHISPREITLAETLKAAGYKTFMAGKWHMGDQEEDWPEYHGFDINKGGWTAGSPQGGYFSPYNNPRLSNGEPGENLSLRLANETISFLKDHQKKQKDQPFFAYLAFYAVHGPIETTQEKWKHFRDKAEQQGIAPSGFEVDRTLPVRQTQDCPVYAGLVQQMDDAIGNVLKALEAMGLDKNTLVIFTSDNGGVTAGDSYSTAMLSLRGGKGRQFEGGIRVPAFLRAPGIQKGQRCDVPIIGMDFYPTILSYCGVDMPEEQRVDGVDILPALKGETLAERPLFWHYPHYGNQGGEPSSIVRRGDWKLIFYHEDQRVELYNLAKDIGEHECVNAQHPDKVEELKNLLDAWLIETNARMPKADPTYDPIKEAEVKRKWRTATLQGLEAKRKAMLSEDYKPNADWWGSQPE